MKTQYFETYQSKLNVEAIIKSALCGLAVGFGANFLASLVFWLIGFDVFWVAIALLFGVALIAAPIFYVKRFRPTDINNARRLDRLGLEERLITMVEYGQQDSEIARIQREDAKLALGKIDKDQLKMRISKSIVAAVVSLAILGTGMTTVNALSEFGVLPGGDEIIDSFVEEQTTVYVTITYEIEDGGMIEGDEEQVIVLGTDGSTVTAVADEGYMFKEWSDGYTNPTRTDVSVTESVIYVAIFTEVSDEEGEEGDGDGEGEGDEPGDAPSDQQENGSGSSSSNGEPNPGATLGGGESKPNNQIVDGETFYREVLEYYQDLADGQMSSEDSGLSDAEIDLIKKYLGIV